MSGWLYEVLVTPVKTGGAWLRPRIMANSAKEAEQIIQQQYGPNYKAQNACMVGDGKPPK